MRPVLVLSLATLFFFLESCGTSTDFYYTCHTSEELDADRRATITSEGLNFAENVFRGDSESVFDQLTDDAKRNYDRAHLRDVIQGVARFGPYEDLRLDSVLSVTGQGHIQQRTSFADCTRKLKSAETGAKVVILDLSQQAYVLISARGSKERWVATLWLVPLSGHWRIESFEVTLNTVANKSPLDLLSLARQEKAKMHYLNAGALYAEAESLSSHGPFYRGALEDTIETEARQVEVPSEFRARPPYRLVGKQGTFSVLKLSVLAIDGKMYLGISHELSPWKEGETKNRALAKVFSERFPEYSAAFAGLVVDAVERDGTRALRTVVTL